MNVDLNTVAAFVRVVEQGTFTAASEVLGVPVATVSRRVAALESRLGVKLLQRTTRQQRLTDAGRAFFERSRNALFDLDEATRVLVDGGDAPRGRLHLTAPTSLATTVVPQWLAAFRKQWPAVAIELTTSNHYLDLVGEGIDLAFRLGPLRDSNLAARKLTHLSYHFVAAPRLDDADSRLTHPSQLADRPTITTRIGHRRMNEWRYLEAGEIRKVTVGDALSTDELDAARALALEGAGYALLPAFVVGDALRSGRLVDVLPEHEHPGRELHAVFPSNRLVSPTVRQFLDSVVTAIETDPGYFDRRRS
ncbi:MAG: LysR substrate-binding domain-containing protein [Pseudomonadota bacterium]